MIIEILENGARGNGADDCCYGDGSVKCEILCEKCYNVSYYCPGKGSYSVTAPWLC